MSTSQPMRSSPVREKTGPQAIMAMRSPTAMRAIMMARGRFMGRAA